MIVIQFNDVFIIDSNEIVKDFQAPVFSWGIGTLIFHMESKIKKSSQCILYSTLSCLLDSDFCMETRKGRMDYREFEVFFSIRNQE